MEVSEEANGTENSFSISADRTIVMSTVSNDISTEQTIDLNETSAAAGGADSQPVHFESKDTSVEKQENKESEDYSKKPTFHADVSVDGSTVSENILKDAKEVNVKHPTDIVHPMTVPDNDTANMSELESTVNFTSQDSSLKETITEGNMTATSICLIAGNCDILCSCQYFVTCFRQ